MFTIVKHIMNRYFGQRAQGMTEYALIVALVVAVGVAVIGTDSDGVLGQAISSLFEKVSAKIDEISL